jgi:hypothetical protein
MNREVGESGAADLNVFFCRLNVFVGRGVCQVGSKVDCEKKFSVRGTDKVPCGFGDGRWVSQRVRGNIFDARFSRLAEEVFRGGSRCNEVRKKIIELTCKAVQTREINGLQRWKCGETRSFTVKIAEARFEPGSEFDSGVIVYIIRPFRSCLEQYAAE